MTAIPLTGIKNLPSTRYIEVFCRHRGEPDASIAPPESSGMLMAPGRRPRIGDFDGAEYYNVKTLHSLLCERFSKQDTNIAVIFLVGKRQLRELTR